MGREIQKACLLVSYSSVLKCELLTCVCFICVYINTHTYTQKHIHTLHAYIHTEVYTHTLTHTYTQKPCCRSWAPCPPCQAHKCQGPERGTPSPPHDLDDLRRALNCPFQVSLSKASTLHVPRSPAPALSAAQRPGALLAALPPVLPPGPSKCRTKCHHPQSRQSPHRSPGVPVGFGGWVRATWPGLA